MDDNEYKNISFVDVDAVNASMQPDEAVSTDEVAETPVMSDGSSTGMRAALATMYMAGRAHEQIKVIGLGARRRMEEILTETKSTDESEAVKDLIPKNPTTADVLRREAKDMARNAVIGIAFGLARTALSTYGEKQHDGAARKIRAAKWTARTISSRVL